MTSMPATSCSRMAACEARNCASSKSSGASWPRLSSRSSGYTTEERCTHRSPSSYISRTRARASRPVVDPDQKSRVFGLGNRRNIALVNFPHLFPKSAPARAGRGGRWHISVLFPAVSAPQLSGSHRPNGNGSTTVPPGIRPPGAPAGPRSPRHRSQVRAVSARCALPARVPRYGQPTACATIRPPGRRPPGRPKPCAARGA